ncbi:MAG: ParB N-terminal domain-containing protein [Mediterraneibacter faecis]|nr:ParB N-terminal domain-containing protein [Mediterraneibacter faecis]
MNIQNISLSDIHPYARNPRKNDEAVKNVAASIREFGFLVPLVIDRNHEIVAGHTRYKAAKSLGMKEVPCVIADELTEDQIKAFRLADNKVSEAAQWDMNLLPLELADIVMPMTDFGFETISDADFSENFTLDDGEKKPFQQISITVHDEQAKLILAAIKYVYDQKAVTETFTNENHKSHFPESMNWVRECTKAKRSRRRRAMPSLRRRRR